jgi:peptidoglycan/xylan/chitin deacetylase (PgdA/CDA1 family)
MLPTVGHSNRFARGGCQVSLIGRARGAAARAFRGPGARAGSDLLERLAGSPRDTFAVLTYHRVDDVDARSWLYPPLLSATPKGFEAQMAAIARHDQPIALPDLLAAFRGTRRLPARAVLVTFDDAYRDFADNAWPILRRLGIPATLFVPTAYPDAPDRPFWWDRVWQAVASGPESGVETPIGVVRPRNNHERRSWARALVEHYKSLPNAETLEAVDALCDQVRLPLRSSDVLRWDELRSLRDDGLALAQHSRTHPLLTHISSDGARAEIEGARADLGREVGDAAFDAVFAYPAGAHDAATRRVLTDSLMELAFTTDRGINRLGRSDPLALRRINVGLRSRSEAIRAQIAVARMRQRLPRR